MFITKRYKKYMENKMTPFSKALSHFISTGKNITQSRISKATGIKQGMISGMKTGKRKGTEEGRRAIAAFFKKPYDEFLAIGEKLIQAEVQIVPASPITFGESTDDTKDIPNFDKAKNARHHMIVNQFKQSKLAEEINEKLLEIEKLDAGFFEEIRDVLDAKLFRLKKQETPKADGTRGE